MKLLCIIVFCFYSLVFSKNFQTQLNSTVMIFNNHDLEQCENQIQKAYNQNNSRIHLVPTIYAKVIRNNVKSFFYRDQQGELQQFNKVQHSYFKRKIIDCIDFASKLDMDIYYTPHIDNKDAAGAARHTLVYSPLVKYKGFSFAEIMFYSLFKLKPKVRQKTYVSLIGETGRSLYLYTQDYNQLQKQLPSDLKLGLSFNFSCYFDELKRKKISFIDELDFIGMSAYNPVPVNCNAQTFQKIANYLWDSARSFGMTKPLALHFTEVGIGGSSSGAFGPKGTARMPYKGQSGAYSLKKDPWRIQSNFQFRKKYYQCLLDFLKNNKTITAAFLWNSDSWDVQGFYPFSSRYRDEYISLKIQDHNKNISEY